MNESKTEFQVPEENFARLTARLDKLNRRAVKLGCAPVQFSVTAETILHRWDREDVTRRNADSGVWFAAGTAPTGRGLVLTGSSRKVLTVSVVGEAPKYAGWSFAATLAISEGGVVLRKAPGYDKELTAFRDVRPVCEHCKLERNRRDTFVLAHEDGTLKQVGRNCLRDFLGHQDPALIAAQAEWRMSIGEAFGECEEPGEGSGERLVCLAVFLTHVAEFTIQKGFVSRKQSQEREARGESCDTTSLLASTNMNPPALWVRKGLVLAISDKAVALAEAAVAHALELGNATEELNDFQHNLLTVARCEAIEPRQLGIAAYLVENYRRDTEQAERRAKLSKDSKHWGTVGVRAKNEVITYLGSNSFDSQFGTCFIHRFAAADGALLVWKTSTGLDYAQGHSLTATFTVKEHSDYKGTKQTLISRTKIA